MGKRTRACEACRRLKIKCDLSISFEGRCERCSRNKLNCVPTAPRLQRDRIAELEAEVQTLRAALQRGSSCSTTPTLSPSTATEDNDYSILSFLDSRIPPSKQQDLLQMYTNRAGSSWPVIHTPLNWTYLREQSPTLLMAVLAYSFTPEVQATKLAVHDELVKETIRILGEQVFSKGGRSVELVQSLLIATLWYKTTLGQDHTSCYELVQLAANMAIDLGLGGSTLQPSAAAYFCPREDASSLVARQTWLGCYVALSASSMNTRRPNPFPQNAYHEECLTFLAASGTPSHLLLYQIVRIHQLIEAISDALHLCSLATFVDGNDYPTHTTIRTLVDRVEVYAAQIPSSLAASPVLRLWRHLAMIYIYEVVLHTRTNKATFAAPFVPERIAVNDFPKPSNIIPPLSRALEALVQNCHGALNTVIEMDPALILSLPTFCVAPAIVYPFFILANAWVMATDPTSTYGQCLTKDVFCIEQCGLGIRDLTLRTKAIDPSMTCFTTRIIDAASLTVDWYHDYTAILRRYETNVGQ